MPDTGTATAAAAPGIAATRLGYGAALRVGGRMDGADGLVRTHAAMVVRRAVDLGASFIDTADSYGAGLSEQLLAEALHPYPPDLVIATKGGVVVSGEARRIDASPAQLRRACDDSLRRLRLDRIELYQLHWPDPSVPFADQVGALAQLREAGKIRHIGLCNVTLAQAKAAHRMAAIAAVQNRFGVADQSSWPMLRWCAETGVAFVAYAPLAVLRAPHAAIGRQVARLATRSGVTPAQVALAWLLRCATPAMAIPGSLSLRHVEENMQAPALAGRLAELDTLTAAG